MEALLSLAFDNLSSYDAPKIRKGLRQVEGLLAQLCLSGGGGSPAAAAGSDPPRPEAEAGTEPARSRPRPLVELAADPAFREFFKLQEGFEWNVALRLVGALDRLVARSREGENDLVILATLDLVQGLMMLHPPSKALFAREQHMNLLLDLLEPSHCPAIQSATLLALVSALIDCPANTRAFEALDGLLTITSLFRSRSTPRDVKLKLVEFLYFYLMPESGGGTAAASSAAATAASASASASAVRKDGGRHVATFGRRKRGGVAAGGLPAGRAGDRAELEDAEARSGEEDDEGEIGAGITRTTEEKQAILGRHLSNVEDLVRDLTASTPFGL